MMEASTLFLIIAGIVVVGFVIWYLVGSKKEEKKPETPSAPSEN